MALNKIVNDFIESQGKSLTTSGYMKLEGGLIIQWGLSNNDTSGTTITFPIAFPNAVLSFQAMQFWGAIFADADTCSYGDITNTTAAVYQHKISSGTVTQGGYGFRWMAIGY